MIFLKFPVLVALRTTSPAGGCTSVGVWWLNRCTVKDKWYHKLEIDKG